ncbi:hypothetical protein D3C71_1593320 [compost metagenome]
MGCSTSTKRNGRSTQPRSTWPALLVSGWGMYTDRYSTKPATFLSASSCTRVIFSVAIRSPLSLASSAEFLASSIERISNPMDFSLPWTGSMKMMGA